MKMSAERRLRDGLQRNAATLAPDVARRLDAVVGLTRRRRRLQRTAMVAAMVAVTAVAVTVGPRALDALNKRSGPVPADQGTPPAPSNGQSLSGSYSTIVGDSPAVAEHNMQGRWTIEFHTDGTMSVDAPPAFQGVLSSPLFESEGDQFRTGLLGQDVCTFSSFGEYRWTRAGDILTFDAINDPCQARVELFTSAPWRVP
jgi:hypothetical protein